MQADHYELHIAPFLQEKGYDGIFKQKTREAMGQYGKVILLNLEVVNISISFRLMDVLHFGVVPNLWLLSTMGMLQVILLLCLF